MKSLEKYAALAKFTKKKPNKQIKYILQTYYLSKWLPLSLLMCELVENDQSNTHNIWTLMFIFVWLFTHFSHDEMCKSMIGNNNHCQF